MNIKIYLTILLVQITGVFSTFGGLFGGGGSCSCAPTPVCPPEPICAPQPIIAAPSQFLPVQVPTSSGCCSSGCYPGDYYPPYACSGCRRNRRREFLNRRLLKRRRYRRSSMSGKKKRLRDEPKSKIDSKCNSDKLRRVMKRAVGMKTSTLKRNIQLLVEKTFGSQYNVLCGRGEFSYTTTTDEYCQAQIMDRTCYVFRRNLRADDNETQDYDDPNESI